VWFRVAWQYLLVPQWLTFYQLFAREAGVVAVRNSPYAVVSDFGSHVPVGRVHDEIRIPVTESFVERQVDLESQPWVEHCVVRYRHL
jgi:hypothetical protein